MSAPFEDSRHAAADAVDADAAFAAFRVTEPVEVRALLRSLLDRNVLVNLSASDGSSYTSTLWTLDPAQDYLTFSADGANPAVQHLVEADEAVAVGYLDRIKLQFDVGDLMLVQGRDNSVLKARLPREVFRFQRRNAYRVRTIERAQPTASFRHPSIPEMNLALRVLDVSIGGCALLLPGNTPPLPAGVRVHQVRLSLDSDTLLEAGLVLHHVTSSGAESGAVRLGCEIVGLSGGAERALQRYIDQTQKQRRVLVED